MTNPELNELLAAVCDDRATEDQRAVLTEMLRGSTEARDEYLRYVDLHAALAEEIVPAVESAIVDYRAGETLFASAGRSLEPKRAQFGPSSRFAWWAVVAASLLLAVVSTWAIVSSGRVITDSSQPIATNGRFDSPAVATLVLTDNCVWKNATIVEGQPLRKGTYELKSGTAMVRMVGGAEVAMVGPCQIELRNAGSARLHLGNVVVRASDDAEGFTLSTPNSEVVDLGTEFAVKVVDAGETEVHVLDGIVEYRRQRTPRSEPTILRAGEAIIAKSDRETTESVDVQSPRFDEVIEANIEQPAAAAVSESFDYPVGTLPIARSDGGEGWSGPWRLRTRDERRKGQVARDDEPLSLQIVRANEPSQSMLKMPAEFTCFVRPLSTPIRMDQDSVTYVSMRLQQADDPPRETWIDPGMRITLRSSKDYFGRWICGGLDGQFQPFIQTGGGVGASSPIVLPQNRPMIWVLKIISREGAGDAVHFRLFSSENELSLSEPAAWHVSTVDIDMSLPLDRVLLSCAGPSPYLVDELRIGSTWRSVVAK